jgi:hypothetical protein
MRAGGNYDAEDLLCRRYVQNLLPRNTTFNRYLGSIYYTGPTTGNWELPYVAPMRQPQSSQFVFSQLPTGSIVNSVNGTSNTGGPVAFITPAGVMLQFTGAWGETVPSPYGLTYNLFSNGFVQNGNVFINNELRD